MSTFRQAPILGRRALVALIALALVAGLVIVFSGALTRSTDIEARAQQVRAETARIEAQVAAGEEEVKFIETDDFFKWQARAIGYGEEGEQPFELPEDAPSPAPIVPIGPQAGEGQAKAPFDAWVELLFGT